MLVCFSFVASTARAVTTFTNTASLTIPETGTQGIASLYPTTINVSGFTGTVDGVTVDLFGLSHTFPGDVDVLLVGPTGAKSVLFADVLGASDFINANVTVATGGATFAAASGTYAPEGTLFTGPAPAPVGPYTADLTIFDGLDPNGIWSLYIFDESASDVGSLTGGWALNFLDPPAPPVLAATHWLGQTGGANLWSAANWASDATGTATTAIPTADDDVTFTATGSSGQRTTTLDQNFTIKSLTVNAPTGIYGTGNVLTVTNATSINDVLLSVNNSTLLANAPITVTTNGTLAGDGGVIQTAAGQNIIMNGAINVGDPGNESAAAILQVRAFSSEVVMGPASLVIVDIYHGNTLGDNTGDATSADRLSLWGTMNATGGGTLVILNPNGMNSYKGGDQWLLVDMEHKIAGEITGTLAVNDAALHLKSTQTGNFDQTTGIYKIIETETGLQIATAQDSGVMSGIQGILGDINGRLFNLRAGWGEEPQGSISDSLSGGIDDGVIDGQGDGPEQPVAKVIPRSRQWEVYTTVNYANISLSSIRSQAGVDSQTWAPGVGIERHFSRHLTLGFAANLLETHQTYTNGLGSMDMEGIALSAYASYVRRSFWVDMLYSWGRFDLESQRNSTGFPVANGETTAWTNAVQLNGGWSFRVPAWKLVHGPLAGVDWLHLNTDSYNETGGGLGALNYASRSVDSLITRIGWSVSKEFDTDLAKITPQVRLSYERQNIDRNNGTSVNLINQPFTATAKSESPGQSYMVAGAGVNFEFSRDFSMLLTYQGQFFRENMQAHYGSVRFTYKF